jgi:SAM-dependent methyltransferase
LERSEFFRPRLRVLDAGAGFGTAIFALLDALRQRRIEPQVIDAFDLTPAMLEQFQAELDARGITLVRLKQANVLALGQFPPSWSDYDLIVCTSMLEYLAKGDLSRARQRNRARKVTLRWKCQDIAHVSSTLHTQIRLVPSCPVSAHRVH